MTVDYSYGGKFEGNVLIVGQTGCGKVTFIQKLARNNLFGELKEIFWISRIPLSAEREKNISTCFKKTVKFKFPQTVDELDMELTFFQRKRQSNDSIDIVMGENNVFNKLIVTDDVSGLAYRSSNFANFFDCFTKIQLYLCLCFSYNIPY